MPSPPCFPFLAAGGEPGRPGAAAACATVPGHGAGRGGREVHLRQGGAAAVPGVSRPTAEGPNPSQPLSRALCHKSYVFFCLCHKFFGIFPQKARQDFGVLFEARKTLALRTRFFLPGGVCSPSPSQEREVIDCVVSDCFFPNPIGINTHQNELVPKSLERNWPFSNT